MRNPPRSCDLHGGFFAPSGRAKASPFGSNGDDRRQWRKQGGAVGAAASRMRAAAKQTLGAATRAVSPKVTERASPAGKSRCAAMVGLFVRAILSQCLGFAVSGLALSVSSQAPRQLPQRGSHWHVGQLSSGRAKHNISETVVLRCLGQRQLDKERCPEAAVPVSKARPFAPYRASVVQWKVIRPAKASPSGGGVAVGDGEGSVNLWKMHD